METVEFSVPNSTSTSHPFPQTQGFVEEEAGRAQEAMDEHKGIASSRQMCRAAAHMN